jgi:thiamine kinase-like enzyme
MPVSLVHGDFYSSNVLVGGGRVCAVDWEMAGVGPPLLDLAALSSGDWEHEDRLEMVRGYLDSAKASRTWAPSLAETMQLLDHCLIFLAVQWLGWSPNWEPPSRHARDWLEVAEAAAERIAR